MDHTDDGVDRDDWFERRFGMIGGNRMVVGRGPAEQWPEGREWWDQWTTQIVPMMEFPLLRE